MVAKNGSLEGDARTVAPERASIQLENNMNKPNCTSAAQHVKNNGRGAADLAERAHKEISFAGRSLLEAGALFVAIEKAILDGGNKDLPLLLAQIGIETTGSQAERAESESDYFSGVAHG